MTIWVDMTTSYNWKRPAVGVVRVEMEVVKALLDDNLDVKYFRYDNTLKNFIEITQLEARSITERISLGLNISEGVHIQEQNNKKEQFFNVRKNEVKHYLLMAVHNIYLLILSCVSPAYHGKVKKHIKKVISYFKQMRHLTKFVFYHLQSKLLKKKNVDGDLVQYDGSKESLFNNKDIFNDYDSILSLGAVWNYPNINLDFHALKKDKNIRVYSISFDLIPIIQPHLCLDYVSAIFKELYYDMIWYSSHIFCISKSTERDLETLIIDTGLPDVDKSVITLGCDINNTKKKDPVVTEFLKGREPYLLFVSTIESRKNHDLIYKVMSKWLDEGLNEFPSVVIVGMPGWGVNDLLNLIARDKRLQGKLHILDHVSDIGLKQLYESCLFTLYPSFYEGWGLPVTESLSYGKFCIASDTSSMPEAGFGFVDCISPYDIVGWSTNILNYFNNHSLLFEKEEYIKKHFSPPSWKQTAMAIISEVKSGER